jgi:hypothetical protein
MRVFFAYSLYPAQWQTTWDRSKLFSSVGSSPPINFVKPGPAASADIVVSDSTKYQTIVGFGGTLSEFQPIFPVSVDGFDAFNAADSSALTLSNLKVCCLFILDMDGDLVVVAGKELGELLEYLDDNVFTPGRRECCGPLVSPRPHRRVRFFCQRCARCFSAFRALIVIEQCTVSMMLTATRRSIASA